LTVLLLCLTKSNVSKACSPFNSSIFMFQSAANFTL
jgi:hypothetical protein